MRDAQVRIILFTRLPVAGKAKTRLIPACGAERAADIHRILTEKTVATLKASYPGIEIFFTGGQVADFESWLGCGTYTEQATGDLSDRLLAAIHPAPVIFFGSDTPDLEIRHVESAIAALQHNDVVIGPAADGGYYLIGIAKTYRFLFENMPWSTDNVLPETLRRIASNNLIFELLETLHDCDTPEDLARWPWLMP